MIGFPTRFWRRQIPRGLLGMLGMVLAIELSVKHHELNFKHCFTYDWVVTGRWAEQRALGCDVLCFGDSLANRAFHACVALDNQSMILSSGSFNYVAGAFRIDIKKHDGAILRKESSGNCGSNARGGSRDENGSPKCHNLLPLQSQRDGIDFCRSTLNP